MRSERNMYHVVVGWLYDRKDTFTAPQYHTGIQSNPSAQPVIGLAQEIEPDTAWPRPVLCIVSARNDHGRSRTPTEPIPDSNRAASFCMPVSLTGEHMKPHIRLTAGQTVESARERSMLDYEKSDRRYTGYRFSYRRNTKYKDRRQTSNS
jgi:hypothetical protein